VGIAVDGKRNVYIADFGSGRVRKVSPDGTITTFAGSPCRRIAGTPNCETGDGGPATSAYLHQPHGIALDRLGNVYITDYRDHRVRKVSLDGTITIFAGIGGKGGFSGDGGPATKAQLYGPTGIAFDAKGNAYITDQLNGRVRKVAPNGTITTFAGNGQNHLKYKDGPATKVQLGNVFGVAVDKAGSVYIADSSPPRILRVSGGKLTRVAGRDPHGPSGGIGEGGPATAAQMAGPNGVAVDSKGNLFVVDTAYNTVRKVWNGRRGR
jgi:sugar lactone lactonase YvrE